MPLIFRTSAMSPLRTLPLLLLLAVSVAFPFTDGRSSPGYGLDGWDARNGLGQFAINAIRQTAEGYLWLGTDEGLVRFDGFQFILISEVGGDRLGEVSALELDGKGTLWIATRRSGIFLLTGGAVVRFDGGAELLGRTINALALAGDGSIWVGASGGAVFRLDDGRVARVPYRDSLSTDVMALCPDGERAMWSGSGLLSRHGDATAPTRRLQSDLVFSLCIETAGTLWVGALSGLHRYETRDDVLRLARSFPTGHAPRAILRRRNGEVWIGTEGSGVFRIQGDRLERYEAAEGLSGSRVLSLFEDREGHLWIGTRGGGLKRLRDRAIATLSVRDGLRDAYVTAVAEDRSGSLLVGTRGGGMSVFTDGKLSATVDESDGLLDGYVRALAAGRDGSVWIGTTRGLHRWRAGARRAEALSAGAGVPLANVRAVVEDRRGDLWIGNYGGGVLRYRRGIFALPGLLSGRAAFVRTLYEDHDGTMWAGTAGGLARFRGDSLRLFTELDGLSGHEIFALAPDPRGGLLIGTYGGGLNRHRDGVFRSVGRREGLYDDIIFAIVDDGIGNLWMSCNKGIFRVRIDELESVFDGKASSLTSVAYGVESGMESAECNGGSHPSAWRRADGELVFPTVRGAAYFRPEALVGISRPIVARIDQIVSERETVAHAGDVALAAGTRNFDVTYTAIRFVGPEHVRFEYRLDGFDERWVRAGARRTAYYTNVAPGEYRFRVRASAGGAEAAEASVAIVIAPFFWETGWFLTASGAVLVAVLVGMVRWRERRIRRSEERRNEILRQVTELKSRALRAQMNPHFMFNSLNAIQECILSGNNEVACGYLSKFAQLLRLILEHAEEPHITLDEELRALRLYLELESLRLEGTFAFTIEAGMPEGGERHRIPSMLLQPYVENAIWHGLMHKSGDRRLTIALAEAGGILRCRIEDNGVGREEATVRARGRGRTHESKGMAVTRERLEAMGPLPDGESPVTVIDLYEGDRAAGTRVELRIPLVVADGSRGERS